MNRPTIFGWHLLPILPLSALALLTGCEMMNMTPTATTQTEYVPVEYRRFVSGVYVAELKNKFVQVDCRFSSTMSGTLPGGLSPDRYMAFLAVAPIPGNILESPEPLTVVLPKDIADVVFSLQHGDPIRIKGQALEVFAQRGGGSVYRNLILQANLIEKL
jgi:hypothetical protein